MELFPAIDILDGKAVRLEKGDYTKVKIYHDSPLEQAKIFEDAGAVWLHVVDLDGARSGISENISTIEDILEATSLKVEVGGGIRSLEALERLEQAGVSRAVLGTSLVNDPDFAREAIERFGGLLAAGVDARQGEVAVEGWREGAGLSAESLIYNVAQLGFEHLVYTDISRDGMQTGLDVGRYVEIAKIFGNPVVASGGVSGIDDIANLAKVADSIEGVIVGRALYEGSLDIGEAIQICKKAK